MDIQYSADFRISKNRFMDIQKSIYGYPKIELWISKKRIMDINKWGIKSKTAPHTEVHIQRVHFEPDWSCLIRVTNMETWNAKRVYC